MFSALVIPLFFSVKFREASFKFGNSDALSFWVVVFVVETVTLERKGLHLVVIKGAYGVDVLSSSEFLKLVNGGVNAEHLFHAVEVFADVVLVLEHTKGSVDLIFVHFLINNYNLHSSLQVTTILSRHWYFILVF
jgi:hypothetical protein